MEEKAAYSLSDHNCRDHAEESIDEAAEILACSPEGEPNIYYYYCHEFYKI